MLIGLTVIVSLLDDVDVLDNVEEKKKSNNQFLKLFCIVSISLLIGLINMFIQSYVEYSHRCICFYLAHINSLVTLVDVFDG